MQFDRGIAKRLAVNPNDGLAALLHLADHLLFALDDFAGRSGRGLPHHGLKDLLVGVAQLAPEVPRDDRQQSIGDMPCQNDLLLDFIELLGINSRQRVFLRIDRTVLEREIDLSKGDWGWIGTHCPREHGVKRRVRDPDLQTLHVFRLRNRAV